MSVRDELNEILVNIGQPTLTDEEFETITLSDDPERLDLYLALIPVLKLRSVIDDSLDRLKAYALAIDSINIDIETAKESVFEEASNVFLGAEL